MVRAPKSASIHIEVRTAGLRTRDRGPELLLPLPLDRVILWTPWIDPRDPQRKLRKSSRKCDAASYSSPGLGLWRLTKPSLVKGPHRNDAT